MSNPSVRLGNQNTKRTSHYITDVFDNRVIAPDMTMPEPDIWIRRLTSSGLLLQEYEVTLAGLTYALADAVPTNIVEIPICEIVGDVAVPAGVKLCGVSRLSSVIIGTVVLSDLSILEMLTVTKTGSDAGPIVGVYGPVLGYSLADPAVASLAKMYSVSVNVENNVGPAYAVELDCGSLTAYDTELLALIGTQGYAAFVAAGVFTHFSGRAVGTDPDGAYWLDV